MGDALGATTEFLTPREIREKHGVHDRILGGGWLRLKAGQVTDDTEMSLALGESILARRGVEAAAVAEAFSEWMRGKPIDIGNTVRRGLVHYRTTGESAVAMNEFDAGNGACMRSLPIALFYCDASHEERMLASRAQSHTTHNNPLADAGTETMVEMVVSAM
ncbi:MAG: ADP-ribosylglycohydrolase family protein, partial [Candidatus Thiodiazotropha sp.]